MGALKLFTCKNCGQLSLYGVENEYSECFCNRSCYEQYCAIHNYEPHAENLQSINSENAQPSNNTRLYFITSVGEGETYPVHRCVGYVSDLHKAIDIVENNTCDLNEVGCYPWCVIECIPEGLYQYDFEPLWFGYNTEIGKYRKIDCKPSFIDDHFVSFAIG